MKMIYTVLFILASATLRKLQRYVMAILFFAPTFFCFGQTPTLYESFDDTPSGEIPDGWRTYSLNGSGGSNWVRSTYGFFGPKVMTSGVEYALPGTIDEDWLVTPQITPLSLDHLIFDAGQEYVWDDHGSEFLVLISTSSDNRADFTDTLAIWTEPEFPGYLYEERIILDLAAYEGTPIYIAFVHNNPVTGEGADPNLPPPPIENWYLDNVSVRPKQSMDYSGGEIFSSYQDVIRVEHSRTSIIMGLVVRAAGDEGAATISSLTFTSTGSSPLVHIKEASLYTTHGDSFISTDEANGVVFADLYGTVTDPGTEFTIVGSQDLERGDTYFWLIYTLEADPNVLTYPYPEVDATFEKVVVNDVEHETTVPTTEGSHPVVPSTPLNDNYADALDLQPSATPARYGSYNNRATFETEFEKLAYCATPIYNTAQDGANSVWWHFHAPRNGVVTIDLSACSFNTLLLIQDENHDQLACNKDIDEDALVFQSKIVDFQVEDGKDYYVRVSGEGAFPGDPNAASGVVHMDFSFSTPVGVEENFTNTFTPLYPNPATKTVCTDLLIKKPTEIILDIVDLVGRPVLSNNKGVLNTGMHEGVCLDISSLPAGPYLVQMRGDHKKAPRKLIVVK
jgi:hypothetical protein